MEKIVDNLEAEIKNDYKSIVNTEITLKKQQEVVLKYFARFLMKVARNYNLIGSKGLAFSFSETNFIKIFNEYYYSGTLSPISIRLISVIDEVLLKNNFTDNNSLSAILDLLTVKGKPIQKIETVTSLKNSPEITIIDGVRYASIRTVLSELGVGSYHDLQRLEKSKYKDLVPFFTKLEYKNGNVSLYPIDILKTELDKIKLKILLAEKLIDLTLEAVEEGEWKGFYKNEKNEYWAPLTTIFKTLRFNLEKRTKIGRKRIEEAKKTSSKQVQKKGAVSTKIQVYKFSTVELALLSLKKNNGDDIDS